MLSGTRSRKGVKMANRVYDTQWRSARRKTSFGIGDPLKSKEGWKLYGHYNKLSVQDLEDEIRFRKDTMMVDEFQFLTSLYTRKKCNLPITPL